MNRPKPRPIFPAPEPITFGAYTAAPNGPVDATGACRWWVTGPGMTGGKERRTRFLSRDEMLDELVVILRDVAVSR